MSMGEPEVTGSGAEDDGEYDEMMSTPAKVAGVWSGFTTAVGRRRYRCSEARRQTSI